MIAEKIKGIRASLSAAAGERARREGVLIALQHEAEEIEVKRANTARFLLGIERRFAELQAELKAAELALSAEYQAEQAGKRLAEQVQDLTARAAAAEAAKQQAIEQAATSQAELAGFLAAQQSAPVEQEVMGA